MNPSGRFAALAALGLLAVSGGAVPLAAGQAVAGRVLDDSGRAVAGATVRLTDADLIPIGRVQADPEGWFHLPVGRPGTFHVIIEATGFAASLSDLLSISGRGFVDHSVRLVPVSRAAEPVAVVRAEDLARACAPEGRRHVGGIVVGQVWDSQRETLRGVWVSAEWQERGLTVRREVRSGVDGLFVFCAIPSGLRVTVRAAVTDRVGPATGVLVLADAVHHVDVDLPAVRSDRPGRVLGRIVEVGSGAGIAAAELVVQGTEVRAWTDANGHFALDSLPPGLHTLRVDHVAFAAREVGMVVAPDGSHGIQVPMAHEAIELDPVVVTVRSTRWYGEMRAFQRRMLLGAGVYLTREDIQRLQPTRLVDLLRQVPGVSIRDRAGSSPQVRMRGRPCDPELVVDRVRLRDRGLLTELRGVDLEAVEVYRSAAENPGEFGLPGACGSILVWTRRAVV